MAKNKSTGGVTSGAQKKVQLNHADLKSTSIGDGPQCKPKHKHWRRNWKRYRGQGK